MLSCSFADGDARPPAPFPHAEDTKALGIPSGRRACRAPGPPHPPRRASAPGAAGRAARPPNFTQPFLLEREPRAAKIQGVSDVYLSQPSGCAPSPPGTQEPSWLPPRVLPAPSEGECRHASGCQGPAGTGSSLSHPRHLRAGWHRLHSKPRSDPAGLTPRWRKTKGIACTTQPGCPGRAGATSLKAPWL